MPISGKYNFKGMKKMGAAGFRSVLASSPKFAWLLNFKSVDLILEFISNFLANRGLIILNVPVILVDGEVDQYQLDKELDRAYEEIKNKGGRDNMSIEEKRVIDEKVKARFRELARIAKPN